MGAEDHGKLSTYNNYKCRCPECREANARYQRERRGNMPDAQREYTLAARRRAYKTRGSK